MSGVKTSQRQATISEPLGLIVGPRLSNAFIKDLDDEAEYTLSKTADVVKTGGVGDTVGEWATYLVESGQAVEMDRKENESSSKGSTVSCTQGEITPGTNGTDQLTRKLLCRKESWVPGGQQADRERVTHSHIKKDQHHPRLHQRKH